ncbi:MAG: nucleotide pyrophosphohydrolase [Planctomycetota bacterium]
MDDNTTVINEIKKAVMDFCQERDWAQFHSPKNLVMGLSIEAAELMEHFLWKTGAQSEHPDDLEAVGQELADVFIFTLNLAARINLDLAACAEKKLKENAKKYPSHLARGKALKHTHYKKYE